MFVKRAGISWVLLALSLSGCPGMFPPGSTSTSTGQSGQGRDDPSNPPTPKPSQPSGPDVPVIRDPNAVLPEGFLPPSYLVSNQAGSLAGVARGPSTLVANNAGSLISNNSSGLVANNAASLISNNSSGLVANNSSSFRVQAVNSVAVANGFVYLTTPADRIYLRNDRRLFAALTDATGSFKLGLPATDSVIVNVLLLGDRRLTAILRPDEASGSLSAGSARRVEGKQVTLGTTLVTEFLRAKASEFDFSLEEIASRSDLHEALSSVERLTEEWLSRDQVAGLFVSQDLAVSQIPVLRHKYVLAMGSAPYALTADQKPDYRLSDAWVDLLKAIKRDPGAPDLKYRPLAVSSLETGAIGGATNQGIAVDDKGTLYAQFMSNTNYELRERDPATGTWRTLMSQLARGTDLPLDNVNFLRWFDGKLVFGNSVVYDTWVGLFDPTQPLPSLRARPDFYDPLTWTNPVWLHHLYGPPYYQDLQGAENIAFSDALLIAPGSALGSRYNLFMCDGNGHTVWRLEGVDPASPSVSLSATASLIAGRLNEKNAVSGLSRADEASGSLRFNGPVDCLYLERERKPHLLVSDTGNHSIVDIDLSSGQTARIIGEAGSYVPGEGKREFLPLRPTIEHGGNATDIHLNFPHQLVKAGQSNGLYLGDSDNRLIRFADPYGTGRAWILAGNPRFFGQGANKIPFAALGDGEGRELYISRPYWLARDRSGNLFFNEEQSSRLRKLWSSFLYQERVQP